MRGVQLALDGRDTRVKVVTMPHYGHGWFAAKCTACGGWLTKYDFTEDEAVAVAVHALDRTDGNAHRCIPRSLREAVSPHSERMA